jgi:hypothetical protein
MSSDLPKLWGAVRAAMQELSIPNIRRLAGQAGFDVTRIPSRSEAHGGSGSRAEVMPALDRLFLEMDESERRRAVQVIAEEFSPEGYPSAQLRRDLERLGYGFVKGKFVRFSVLSQEDMDYLPETGREDLAEAATRLRDGKLSGALSSICGAIDSATSSLYQQKALGEPGNASFQERVARSLEALGTYKQIAAQLCSLGWPEKDAEKLSQNLKGAINQAAYVLQTLRSNMSDVHGTKPTIRWIVFEALKWGQAILALLNQPEERS